MTLLELLKLLFGLGKGSSRPTTRGNVPYL